MNSDSLIQIDFGHRSVDVKLCDLRRWHRGEVSHTDICKALRLKPTAPAASIRGLVADIATQTPGAVQFMCLSCGAMTYGCDAIGPELCEPCYELAGLDNQCNDESRAPDHDEGMCTIAWLDEIARNGGDADRARASCEYIWPNE